MLDIKNIPTLKYEFTGGFADKEQFPHGILSNICLTAPFTDGADNCQYQEFHGALGDFNLTDPIAEQMRKMEDAKEKLEAILKERNRNNPPPQFYKSFTYLEPDLGSVSMFKKNLSKIGGIKERTVKNNGSFLTTYTKQGGELVGTIEQNGKKITATAGGRTCYASTGKEFEKCTDTSHSGNKYDMMLESYFYKHAKVVEEKEK